MKSLPIIIPIVSALLLAGCNRDEPASRATTTAAVSGTTRPSAVSMKIGDEVFQLEIADTDEARQRGLMYRQSMARDHGMIFVFPTDQPRAFWMRNTLIPLDIIYVNGAGKVVSIKPGVPLQEEPTIPSDLPMKYAIELNGGAAARAGVKVGDPLELPQSVRQLSPEPG